MGKSDHSGAEPPAKRLSDKERREDQLAAALRANLRRRKAPAPAARKPADPQE